MRVLTPTLDGDLLAVLASAEKSFTTGDLQRQIGHTLAGIRKTLQRLVSQGIVLEQPAGPAVLYTLNREHLAAPAIATLAALRAALFEQMRDDIAAWKIRTPFAAVFGSTARGDSRVDSDVDVFIIRPDSIDADDDVWRAQVTQLEHRMNAWTGNDVRALEFAADALQRGGEPVLADVERDGIVVAGTSGWLRRAAGKAAIK